MPKESIIPLYYQIYFCFKPIMPRRIWFFIRRWRARHIWRKNASVWPIDPSAGKLPEVFLGWPDGKRFCLVLTHDVERAEGVAGILPLLELEREMGFYSAFHLVGQDYEVPERLRRQIVDSGFSVGLHGLHHNYHMYKSEEKFKESATHMNRILEEWNTDGFRSPSLFHHLDWIHYLSVRYDSSTADNDPFEPQPDGVHTIFPFIVNSHTTKHSYVELPITMAQDHTLFCILKEKTIDLWKQKLNWIAEHQGMALINVHPDYINFPGKPKVQSGYPLDYYVQLLQYIKDIYKGQYWNALPGEVADYWRREYDGLKTDIKADSQTYVTGKHIGMPTYSFYESDNRVRRYAETLVKEGNSVEVFCLWKKGQASSETIKGVQVHRIQQRTKNETSRFSYLGKLLLFLINSGTHLTIGHIRRRFDLIHVHNIPDFEVFAALIPKLMGSQVILDIHDIVPELFRSKFKNAAIVYNLLRWIERVSTSFADHVIVANDLWYQTLCKRSVSPAKCTVFLNYPDLTLFPSANTDVDSQREIFIFPGSLNHHQGLDIAIEAFALISEELPHSEFHIYGEGMSKESLIALTVRKGLQNRVLFKSPLPTDQIVAVMERAMCGIVPKRADSFGNTAFSTKILEFMALGVPVIVSETEIDRYYFDDSTVLFFKAGNVNDLAQKMIQLVEDQCLRKRLIGSAKTFVQKYRWDSKKDSYLQLIKGLIEKNK